MKNIVKMHDGKHEAFNEYFEKHDNMEVSNKYFAKQKSKAEK